MLEAASEYARSRGQTSIATETLAASEEKAPLLYDRNADPRALVGVSSADEAFRRMGMPEGLYPMTHDALYLACAPKSNAVKNAWHRAKALIEEHGSLPVPMKLRNAVTNLARSAPSGR